MNKGHIKKLLSVDPNHLHREYKRLGSLQAVLRYFSISSKSKAVGDKCREILELVEPGCVKKHTRRLHYTEEDIKNAVKSSMCMSDVLRNLGLAVHGNNSVHIKKLIVQYQIDDSHFDVVGSMMRNKHRWMPEEVFVERSPIPRATLHTHVKRHGVLGKPVCMECKVEDVYNGKPIRLTVDHINGISDDNRIENLRWLCPNCHSQTDTYCGKNS